VWQGAYSTSKAALHSLTDTLDVELRPLGVRAMLLAPGVIQSNIGINAFTNATPPPADSLYTDFHEHIPDTRKYTHHPSTTPADVFARKVVNAALAPTPARYLALGHMSWFVYLLTWLPRSLRLDIFWKTNVKSISGKSA
jgi:1-acylglycerone phosphate reductase